MKGQSLIESVIALGVIGIVLSSIALTLITSLNSATQGKDQGTATHYAQEGVEIVRRIRNNDYQNFKNFNGTYCIAKDATVLGSASSCNVPNIDSYIRSVNIEQSPGCALNVAKISVKVSWFDGRCSANNFCNFTEIISCLSTQNPIKSP